MLVDREARFIRLDDDMNVKSSIGLPNKIANEYTFGEAEVVYDAIHFAHMYEEAYAEQHRRDSEAVRASGSEDPNTPIERSRHWQHASYIRDLMASEAMAELAQIVPNFRRKQIDAFYAGAQDRTVIDLDKKTSSVVVELAPIRELAQHGSRFSG